MRMNGGDRRRIVLFSAALVVAAVAGALCGCEDDEDDGRTVTTQVLADGSTQTVETAVFTQADGTLATQVTTTVVQPDGSGTVDVSFPGGVMIISGNPPSWSSNSPPSSNAIAVGVGRLGTNIGGVILITPGGILTNSEGGLTNSGSSGGILPPFGTGTNAGTFTVTTNQP